MTSIDKINRLIKAIQFIKNETKFGRTNKDGEIVSRENAVITSLAEFKKYKIGTCIQRALYYQSVVPGGRFLAILSREAGFGHFIYFIKVGPDRILVPDTNLSSTSVREFKNVKDINDAYRKEFKKDVVCILDDLDFLIGTSYTSIWSKVIQHANKSLTNKLLK